MIVRYKKYAYTIVRLTCGVASFDEEEEEEEGEEEEKEVLTGHSRPKPILTPELIHITTNNTPLQLITPSLSLSLSLSLSPPPLGKILCQT